MGRRSRCVGGCAGVGEGHLLWKTVQSVGPRDVFSRKSDILFPCCQSGGDTVLLVGTSVRYLCSIRGSGVCPSLLFRVKRS